MHNNRDHPIPENTFDRQNESFRERVHPGERDLQAYPPAQASTVTPVISPQKITRTRT